MEDVNTWYIYKWGHPDEIYIVYYVGRTINPYQRMQQHLNDINQNSLKGDLLRKLKANGKVPYMTILEECNTEEEAKHKEIYWINFYIELHMPLVNSDLPRPKQIAPLGYSSKSLRILPPTPNDIEANIRLLVSQGLPKRRIARIVGIYGRKYSVFCELYDKALRA